MNIFKKLKGFCLNLSYNINDERMKNLTLSIQREYFEEIINGTKTKEYRQIKPTVKHWYLDANDEIKKYDTITLYTGQFKGKRPGIVIECKGATIQSTKKYITYELGEILEKLNFENLKPYKPTVLKESSNSKKSSNHKKSSSTYQSIHSPEKHAELDKILAIKQAKMRVEQDVKNEKLNGFLKKAKLEKQEKEKQEKQEKAKLKKELKQQALGK